MYGYIRTEAQFLNWVRSALRRVWTKHPVKLTMLQNKRFRKVSSTGRMVFHCTCEKCKKDFKMDDIEVNHKKTVGTLTKENLGEFVTNLLFVKEDDLELVCKPCHSIITYSERSGMSIEESEVEKKVILFTKHPAAVQKEKLRKVGIEPGATVGIRRTQAREYIAARMAKKGAS